jgi:hypothetical protein
MYHEELTQKSFIILLALIIFLLNLQDTTLFYFSEKKRFFIFFLNSPTLPLFPPTHIPLARPNLNWASPASRAGQLGLLAMAQRWPAGHPRRRQGSSRADNTQRTDVL